MKKTLILFLALFLLFLVSPGQAANKFWWGSCLIGGGDCLDGIDGADLTAGDGGIVIRDAGSNTPELYLYRLHESGTAEDSPRVISPDANAGNKRWHLANVFGVSFQTVAVDGYNRIKLTNNTARDPTASSMEIYPEGNIWKLNVNGTEYTLGPINDSATNGETSQTWSADKIYDELALKAGFPSAGIAVSTGSAWGTSKASPAGDVVGTSDDQTLTTKTIDTDDNVFQDMPYDIAWSIVDPNDADIHYIRLQRAVTASSIGCIVDPEGTGESVVLNLLECDSNGDNCATVLSSAITCGNTPTAGTLSDTAWAANAFLKIDIGAVTGTVKTLSIYGVGKQNF